VSDRKPRYSKEKAARMSGEIYDRDIRSLVEPLHNGEVVAIDLDSGAWEVDPHQEAASHRLEERMPDAQIMVVRVGSHFIRRFGAGPASTAA
jgi:hypothetical protein